MEILRIPQLNANEDEFFVTEIRCADGDAVRKGDVLFVLESTKATMDFESPADGFLRGLQVREGEGYPVSRVMAVITATATEEISLPDSGGGDAAGAVRATNKAQVLAQELGVDLSLLKVTGMIREKHVRTFHAENAASQIERPSVSELPLPDAPRAVGILGAGGHARVLVDLMRETDGALQPVAAFDDSPSAPADVLGVPVAGHSDLMAELQERGVTQAALGVGAVTRNQLRVTLFERLRSMGFELPALVHPRSLIEASAVIADGAQIFAGAIVGSNVRIGTNAIVNSGVVVSHDCVIGDHVHLTPGCTLAGNVKVGAGSVIGMGVTIYLGVEIGSNVTIANGAHVMTNVADGEYVKAHAG